MADSQTKLEKFLNDAQLASDEIDKLRETNPKVADFLTRKLIIAVKSVCDPIH